MTVRRAVTLVTLMLLTGSLAGVAVAKDKRPYDMEFIRGKLDLNDPRDRAILEAQEGVESTPDSVPARIRLGNAYRLSLLMPEAREQYEEATRIDPESSVAWNNLGIAERVMRDDKAAVKAFERAVATDPRNSEAGYNLAHSLMALGKFEEAVGHMKGVLLQSPHLGNRDTNPRSFGSYLLLPSRIALYRDTLGAQVLPPMGPDGGSGLKMLLETPWLDAGRSFEIALEQESARRQVEEASRQAAEEADKKQHEEDGPVILGPTSKSPRKKDPGKDASVGGRSIRSGGRLPSRRGASTRRGGDDD